MAFFEIPQIRAEQLSSQRTALASVFVLLLWVLYRFKKNSKLPQGLNPWPIIGNLHQLGRLPHRNLYELSKIYDPVISSSTAGELITYNYKNLGMRSYDAYWRHMTKICVMELLSAKRVESFQFINEEEISLDVRSIWERSKQGDGCCEC
ncbi:cytochrome P450 750A1-like [Cryptomeria japonica]|uniref:cytochrome P450 750A1-like n=1 Tax=Cryptomeria japonica TaxID=3369 RepID=UPI0025AC7D21|nr:cytochrome P450 750A1-like [Cryptomeria japonica]